MFYAVGWVNGRDVRLIKICASYPEKFCCRTSGGNSERIGKSSSSWKTAIKTEVGWDTLLENLPVI